jgi:hypothetical protein
VLVFVAEKRTWRKCDLFRPQFAGCDSHRAFEIEFHHDADGLGQPGVHPHWEVQRTHGTLLQKPGEGRQWFSILPFAVEFGVVTLALWAENTLHFRIVVKERKKHGNTFDDRGSEFRLDAFPVFPEPPLDGIELFGLSGSQTPGREW